jgi:phage terminase large subunit-like protein
MVPPFAPTAVKVTLVPVQMVLSTSFADIVTLAPKLGLITIVILFEFATDVFKQGVAFDVMVTETTSASTNVEVA